jgi:hypothetical protein
MAGRNDTTFEVKSDWTPVYRAVRTAFWASVDDMKDAAVGRAPGKSNRLRGSAQIERRGGMAARVKFTAPYAKAIEKGRYSEAKNAPRLAFMAGGQLRRPRATRASAKPYLWPAGRLWKSAFFPNRLKQTSAR